MTRAHVALAGTFGYGLDITKISEEERAMIPERVSMYHKYNDLVREGDYYRVASYRENGCMIAGWLLQRIRVRRW